MASSAQPSHDEGAPHHRSDPAKPRPAVEAATLVDQLGTRALGAGARRDALHGLGSISLTQLHRTAGNGAVGRLLARKALQSGPQKLQRKPNDINTTTTIHLVDKEVQEAEGARERVSVATPVNKVSGARWAKPTVDLKGGHLYKREFGGADDYTNVVPWHADIEQDYTDKFEDVYSKGWKPKAKGKAKAAPQGKGAKAKAPVAEAWNLNVQATFTETSAAEVEQHLPAPSPAPEGKEDPAERKRFVEITRWSIDTIPATAKASIEKVGVDGTKVEWTADPPKEKTGIVVNDDKPAMRQNYDYAHKLPNFEGPLDGDEWIGNMEDKLKEGANN